VKSSEYTYAVPAVSNSSQETFDHPDPSSTPTPQRQYRPEGRPGASGLQAYPALTRQPLPSGYPASPFGSNAQSGYNTTRSGWPTPSEIPRQYPIQTVQNDSPYFQRQYDEPTRRTAASSFQPQYAVSYGAQTAPSHFGGESTVQPASLTTFESPYQSRDQPGSRWSSLYDGSIPAGPMALPRASHPYSTPFGGNATPGYQNRNSAPGGRTAPSGFKVNMAPAVQNLYSVQTVPSSQRETPNYPPAPRRGGPQSMYVSTPTPNSKITQPETGGSASSEEDPVDKVIRKIEISSLRDQRHRRSSVGTLFQ
jgi:hypothetical protein